METQNPDQNQQYSDPNYQGYNQQNQYPNCPPGGASGYNNTNQSKIPPKTWLTESILVTIFCCLPFGIVGIVQASKVETEFYAGRFESALKASADAKKWTVLGFWIGLGVVLLYIIVYVVLLALGMGAGMLNAFY